MRPRHALLPVVIALVAGFLACSSAALAAEPAAGPFEGKTETGYVVSFEVRERAVFELRFTLKWGFCGPAPVHLEGRVAEIDSNGHFFVDEGQYNFDGTFVSPTEVEGTATFLEHPLAGCPKEAVPYTARLRTGPPPVVPACTDRQLKVSLFPRYPGAGYHFLNLVLDNRGGRCALRGFPWLRLLGAGGKPLPTRTIREGPAPPMTMEPKEALGSTVRWDPRPSPAEARHRRCRPVPHGVLAHIPGGIVRRLPWHWGRVCKQGTLRVTAFG
jgi:uncharacterized protein DUF4232